jgi:dTDP-glucose 4,6-dehydratase
LRILVTGGLGIVGKPLVAELRRRGHEVWFCDLYQHHDPQYVRCDIKHIRQLQALFAGREFECVYHLAAEFGRHNGEDYYENLWMTNVIGTKNMLEIQRQRGFRMIFFSSSEVYGDYDGVMGEEVMEQYAIRQMNDYAMSKWVGEMQVSNSADLFDTETVCVRLFNVYGPGEFYSPYRSAVCLFAYRALIGESYKVFTDHHRTSLFNSDAVRTLANICGCFMPGMVYNIGGTEYHDMRSVSDMILSYIGRDDDIVEYVESEPMTTKDKRVDTTRAARDLDHVATVSLAEGIPETIEWMKQTYIDL